MSGALPLSFARAGAGAASWRRAGLAPMIDVVFLLLIFFMLAAQLGREAGLSVGLAAPVAGAPAWQGAPRLVEVAPGAVALNGLPVPLAGLPAALAPLMPAPDSPVLLRAVGGATLQRLIDVGLAMRAAGITGIVIVE